MPSNATNQPNSTVELGYMFPRGLLGPPAMTLTKKHVPLEGLHQQVPLGGPWVRGFHYEWWMIVVNGSPKIYHSQSLYVNCQGGHYDIYFLQINNHWFLILHLKRLENSNNLMVWRQKGRDLTQSFDKRPYTHRKIQKALWQHKKNATKKYISKTFCDGFFKLLPTPLNVLLRHHFQKYLFLSLCNFYFGWMPCLISFERCQSSCVEHRTSEHYQRVLSYKEVGFEPSHGNRTVLTAQPILDC